MNNKMKKQNIIFFVVILVIIVIIVGILIVSSLNLNSGEKQTEIDNQSIGLSVLTINVAIPCGGHAPIIITSLKTLPGVEKIDYTPISKFKVYYNSTKTSKQEILSLEIFKQFKATEINS